jgi:tetratricopeptide (TPR) repeat protein
MRILIADDSASLPAAVQDLFGGAPAGAAGSKTPSVESVIVALGGGASAAAAPAKSAGRDSSSEGCPPAEPLPPCPPCSLHDQPELLATILDAIGMALLNRGCIEAGSRFVSAARDIRLANFGKNHPFTAASYNSYARVLRIRDELIEAEKEVGKAIVINRRVYGGSGLPLAANLNELGAVRLYQGDFKGALKAAERGLSILKKRGVYNEDPNTSRLLDVKGRAHQGLVTPKDKVKQLRQAASALSQALKLDQKQVGTDHPKYATHRANLATVQEALEQYGDAREGYELALRVYATVLGRLGHPNLIDTYANYGGLLTATGDLAAAKDHLCRALGLNEQLRGAGHTLVGNDHANLGRYYFKSGNNQAAAAEFRKALAIYRDNVKRKRLPRRHPYIEEAEIWLKRTGC